VSSHTRPRPKRSYAKHYVPIEGWHEAGSKEVHHGTKETEKEAVKAEAVVEEGFSEGEGVAAIKRRYAGIGR